MNFMMHFQLSFKLLYFNVLQQLNIKQLCEILFYLFFQTTLSSPQTPVFW